MNEIAKCAAFFTIALSGAAVAQGQPATAASHDEMARDCAAELETMKLDEATRGFPKEVRADLRELRKSARVLASHNRQDACEELVDTMNDMVQEHREIIEQREQEAKLRAAPHLSDHKAGLAASTLVGLEVVSLENDNLGEIEEVIIDPARGEIAYLVLAHGGLAGIGQKLIAISWSEVRVRWDDDEIENLIVAANEELLETRNGLDDDAKWPAKLQERWPGNR